MWRPTIDRLVALDASTRTFGSLAWQHMTGLAYVTDRSDLDLIWPMPAPACIGERLAAIASIARAAPMSIDGEFDAPAGAVQWRELAGDNDSMIVKTSRGARIISRQLFLVEAT
ncbi:MAG: phosphoribosyl-dephospho-CoA transferase MdcG domain-containing protein [Hyphomicrobium sp.]